MAFGKGTATKWSIIFLSIALGTLLGVYLQGFEATKSVFRDVTRAGFDMREIDLVFGSLGFKLFFRLNLGSLIGGLFGLWIIR